MSGLQSGLMIKGEQRGVACADFDEDGRMDLAVTQNGAETRLFHNERANPGLRVGLTAPPGNPNAIGPNSGSKPATTSAPSLRFKVAPAIGRRTVPLQFCRRLDPPRASKSAGPEEKLPARMFLRAE